MVVTQENVKRLPVKPAAKAPPKPKPVHKGSDIVVNNVEFTLSLSAPFMFGVPLRLIEWLLARLGIVPQKPAEAKAKLVTPTPAKPRRVRPAA